jgi:Rrf2 family protein
MVEMARQPEKEFWRVQELAELTDTPAPFLAKTFQELIRANILTSKKGRNGGFSFDKPPEKISILKVVETIDGTELENECALGFPQYNPENPCPFHDDCGPLRQVLIDLLSKFSEALFTSLLHFPLLVPPLFLPLHHKPAHCIFPALSPSCEIP